MSPSAIADPPNPTAGALEAAGDAAYAWDFSTDRLDWAGCLAGEALAAFATGQDFAARIHPDDQARRRRALAAHLSGDAAFECEYRLRSDRGGFAWMHERGRAERGRDGRPRRMLGVIRAIDDRSAQQSRIEERVSYDALTGHFNATRLREAVDRIVVGAQRRPQPAAFLAVGIDGIAALGDRLGPEAADAVLVEIGRRLDACLRVSDEVGRLGGDRFGIVLSDCAVEHVGAAAGKLLVQIAETPIATPRGPVSVTVSAGSTAFAGSTGGGETSYDIITRAETALAEAQFMAPGGHLHDPGRAAPGGDRRAGETLRRALGEGRLVFAFQPVVSALTGVIDYHECLLHLREEDGRIIGAGAFVPAVERLGMIRLVDRHVLDRVIEALSAADGFALGCNVSGLTAADRPWLRTLTARLRERPELARRLVIEITETAALYDIEESARFVGALRRAGCRVALDDFGAGHASLRHLHKLPVDMVKFDGAIIRDLATSAESRMFLRHLVSLARGFGFATVAECVETAEHAAILREEGVGLFQGHYCGRPSFDPPWPAAGSGAPESTGFAGLASAKSVVCDLAPRPVPDRQ